VCQQQGSFKQLSRAVREMCTSSLTWISLGLTLLTARHQMTCLRLERQSAPLRCALWRLILQLSRNDGHACCLHAQAHCAIAMWRPPVWSSRFSDRPELCRAPAPPLPTLSRTSGKKGSAC
jgi:hypothetical protein